MAYFEKRGIKRETLVHYNVGAAHFRFPYDPSIDRPVSKASLPRFLSLLSSSLSPPLPRNVDNFTPLHRLNSHYAFGLNPSPIDFMWYNGTALSSTHRRVVLV